MSLKNGLKGKDGTAWTFLHLEAPTRLARSAAVRVWRRTQTINGSLLELLAQIKQDSVPVSQIQIIQVQQINQI